MTTSAPHDAPPRPRSAAFSGSRAALIAALLLASSPARADEGDLYLDRIALADAAWVGLGALAVTAENRFLLPAAAAFVIAAPTMHMLEDEPTHAAWSLGLRVGVPALGGLTAHALMQRDCDRPDGCASLENTLAIMLGAAAGGVVAMALDWALLTRRTGDDESPPVASLRFAF